MTDKNSGNGNGQEETMYDFKAEKAVLGIILVEPKIIYNVVAVLGIKTAVFNDKKNRQVYAAMLELLYHSAEINLLNLELIINQKGELENIGGRTYLASLVEKLDVFENAQENVRIVKEKYLLRCRKEGKE